MAPAPWAGRPEPQGPRLSWRRRLLGGMGMSQGPDAARGPQVPHPALTPARTDWRARQPPAAGEHRGLVSRPARSDVSPGRLRALPALTTPQTPTCQAPGRARVRLTAGPLQMHRGKGGPQTQTARGGGGPGTPIPLLKGGARGLFAGWLAGLEQGPGVGTPGSVPSCATSSLHGPEQVTLPLPCLRSFPSSCTVSPSRLVRTQANLLLGVEQFVPGKHPC